MMPLTMMSAGEKGTVQRISGNDETRKFLENLGFVEGTPVTVVSTIGGNLIVNVRDSRVALDHSMANRIMV
ncbi:MAG: ferrous iron transport protein A [Clostridia bacterium]|nr:ferrous iron transport protein A [Clostridia bacterium]MBQ2669297.1 ferrous iron transport protein A [Clostridia bacterium]MBQ3462442.1 ferrous iron transport protein A [Clostridia bacterium]MBQ6531355.1 ferrous iron transport protein A [Clostridia bacterium]MBQ9598532.1 ferrous iron transport protein A [Clostridia bacterium]